MEKILEENPQRFVLFPIMYEQVWKAYKEVLLRFWTVEDYDVIETPPTKEIEGMLAVYAAVRSTDLIQQLCTEVQVPEMRNVWGFQIAQENIHLELISRMVSGEVECDLQRVRAYESLSPPQTFAERLVRMVLMKTVLFSHLRISAVGAQLKKIWRDDETYASFACLVFSKLDLTRPPTHKMHKMVQECVSLERETSSEAKKAADRVLESLGYSKLYGNVCGDLLFSHASTTKPTHNTKATFSTDEDF